MNRHFALAQRLATRTLTLAGLCLGTAAFAFGTIAHADVIASYDLQYVDSTRTANATTPPNVDSGRYYAHGDTEIYTSNHHGIRVDGGEPNIATISDAVANDEYGEFAITVDPGLQLNLSSLDLGMLINRGTDEETFTLHLRSSIDSYASDIDTASLNGDSDTEIADGSGSFDLSDSAFQGLTGTTTFRLYMVSDVGSRTDGSNYVRITPDVVLNGDVVPEPGTIGLVGLGSLLMLRRRRGAACA